MYKLLLCWRYLRTRYIALACIISVTLGVATMVVVNSVMAGFTHEMKLRIHGVLSDIVVETHGLDGFNDFAWHRDQIMNLVGEHVEALTPTAHVPAMLSFQYGGQYVTRQVNIIAIDPESYGKVSDFGQYLQHPGNREQMDFHLRAGGYDVMDSQGGDDSKPRIAMQYAGWEHRRRVAERETMMMRAHEMQQQTIDPSQPQDPFDGERGTEQADSDVPAADPFAAVDAEAEGTTFDKAKDQHIGVVVGMALASFRGRDGADRFLTLPGDDVKLTFPSAGAPPKAVSDNFTIVDFYESKMSEYDSAFVFMPLEQLQRLRGMIDPSTGVAAISSIQIRLKPGADAQAVRDTLRAHFPPEIYNISTWQDKQGPLLSAVQMESAILNILLFLIVAVAGFGILAIFFMIVVEKTRDIGILKSLGASSRGVMTIFLSYGLLLGTVGAGAGMGLGLLIVYYIDEIRQLIERISGQPVFDPSIYYFQQIPTIVDPFTITWIMCGAMLIAVLASVLPARRAARLHPVEALRYE